MRYFDTKTKTETHIKSNTTIDHLDTRVECFFKEVPEGKELMFNNDNLPFLQDKVIIDEKQLKTNKYCNYYF